MKKYLKWYIIAVIVNMIVGGLITYCNAAQAGKWDGSYHVTFNGTISQGGVTVEEYETENDFTIKGHKIYYGLEAIKKYRLGNVYYTGNNKARIVVKFFGQGQEIFNVKRRLDGSWHGKSHGYFISDGERYNMRGTVNATPIND